MYTISKKEAERALCWLDDGDKVKAIKYVKDITGSGLKESKEAVEARFEFGVIKVNGGGSREDLIQAYLEMAEKQAEVFQRMLDMIEES